jgi:hypothetical protein
MLWVPMALLILKTIYAVSRIRTVPDLVESGTVLTSLVFALLIQKVRNTFRQALYLYALSHFRTGKTYTPLGQAQGHTFPENAL